MGSTSATVWFEHRDRYDYLLYAGGHDASVVAEGVSSMPSDEERGTLVVDLRSADMTDAQTIELVLEVAAGTSYARVVVVGVMGTGRLLLQDLAKRSGRRIDLARSIDSAIDG